MNAHAKDETEHGYPFIDPATCAGPHDALRSAASALGAINVLMSTRHELDVLNDRDLYGLSVIFQAIETAMRTAAEAFGEPYTRGYREGAKSADREYRRGYSEGVTAASKKEVRDEIDP